MAIQIGQKAPDFTLPDTNGNIISLKEFRGKKIVLYFYPRDLTPGCTKEACSFRDNIAHFRKQNVEIFGVSADPVSMHQKFSEKYQLPFSLLSDETKNMLQDYGVWKEKAFMGKKFMGIERTTFIIDENGIIQNVFPKVKVEGHIEEILHAL